MTSENNRKIISKWFYTLGRVLLFCVFCVIILAFCSSLTKNIPFKFTDHLSILSATILTFLLILLFLKWEKLKLYDVGIIPGKSSISRFLCGYNYWLLHGCFTSINSSIVRTFSIKTCARNFND